MDSNTVMNALAGDGGKVSAFPEGGQYMVYVVEFEPGGYMVLNSDDALPLVVAFSPDAKVDLSDRPDNAFRAMLLKHAERAAGKLARMPTPLPATPATASVDSVPIIASTPELHGPFLETSWSQNVPYNKFCPADPNADSYYGGRVPSGCTPTAFAQVLQYHRWPLRGEGSSSYTDGRGQNTGTHSADYFDAYDWDAMLKTYDSSASARQQDAVAELMYELGVIAEADYENSGTASSIYTLGVGLAKYHRYEPISYHYPFNKLIAPLVANMREGLPCVVAIPGHAVVADGLMVENTVTNFHINYGWGGSNNGWWSADNVAGDPIEYGVSSIRPKLVPAPVALAVTGAVGNVSLKWYIPKRIDSAVGALNLYEDVPNQSPWSNDASVLPADSQGWIINYSGRTGRCWYGGPTGRASFVLDDVFVPDANSVFSFWAKMNLPSSTFSVLASVDEGNTYSEIYSEPVPASVYEWSKRSIPLGAFAGSRLKIKVRMQPGDSAWSSGDVWIDDFAMSSGMRMEWRPVHKNIQVAARRFSSAETLIDECADFSVFEHTSAFMEEAWTAGPTGGVSSCFFKPGGGYSNVQYHMTSRNAITPSSGARLLMRAKYFLATDRFAVLVSRDRLNFTEIWSTAGRADWSDVAVDLSAYAGQPIYIRICYVGGSYYSSGGIWIDRISLQTVTNPDCEGQPEYTTAVAGIGPGMHRLCATITDTNGIEREAGEVFTLSIPVVSAIPAWWREQYGIGPYDPDEADFDGDTFSNAAEYVAGTHPRDAASRFSISIHGRTVSWAPAIGGRAYTVEWADSPSGQFRPLHTLQGPASSHVDISDSPQRFYRVKVREAAQ